MTPQTRDLLIRLRLFLEDLMVLYKQQKIKKEYCKSVQKLLDDIEVELRS